jgi:release factor glutamine methyltransferase
VKTYGTALGAGRARLAQAGIDGAGLDARLLLAAAAQLDMAALIARSKDALPALAEGQFDSHLQRRLAGEPVARILGEKEFWGLPFEVNAATLVPRPETETLVESVLAHVRRCGSASRIRIRICDLGTGSGAILIALLRELPDAEGVGTDISEAALATARRNAERLSVAERVSFRRIDFAAGPDGPFDVVVSNPPYIPSGEIDGLAREVRESDPLSALDGGPDGLAAYRTILSRADALLAEGALLALEVGHDQGEAVAALCGAAGLEGAAVRPDLSGAARVVVARRPGTVPREPKAAKKALGNLRISG